jgi:hypothetical protein
MYCESNGNILKFLNTSLQESLFLLHILKERLGTKKIASRWVPHDLTEMQKWLWYDATRMHFERYEREGEAFLCHIITPGETWAKSYKP